MSEYHRHIFFGFSACVPQGLIPDEVYFSIFCPSVEVNIDGSAKVAPCGTRKIEAALINFGFDPEDIIVAHPDHLDKVIGPDTKVVGITENDPLGIGPATSTFTGIFGGEAYMAIKFRELLNHPLIKKYKPKIIVGGVGTWQLNNPEVMKNLNIDCIVLGEGENKVGPLFEKAVKGDEIPKVVEGDVVLEEEMPTIRGATICGLIEIARGCGRGCDFCVPNLLKYRCRPVEDILKEIDVNLKAGEQPILHAEDVLRYKAKGLAINKEAVIDLFKRVKNHPGVTDVGISHFCLSSVVSAPDTVEEITNILKKESKQALWISGQTGVETGSPNLMSKHMLGKCKPFKPEEWPDVVIRAFDILQRNNWVPCGTIIIGLPGETVKDHELTVDLIKNLKKFKSLIVPLFYVSTDKKTKSFTANDLNSSSGELFLTCWEHNLEWADNLLNDYARGYDPNVAVGLKSILTEGMSIAKKYIKECRDKYNSNIALMIRDYREKLANEKRN
jgi:radical SAM superfamily enzyme YgiQ (UPF0313 family)